MSRISPGYTVVEGPVGVGKTVLAKRLATTYDNDLLLESPAENPFLLKSFQDAGSSALPAQLHFLFQHAEKIRTFRQADLFKSSQVADFLIQTDKLFAEVTLNRDELDLYFQVYDNLVVDAPVPDLVIYLQAPVDVLMKRIRVHGMEHEKKIDRDYLEKISDAYIDFFYHYSASPLLIVNTEDLDFREDRGDYGVLLDYLNGIDSGRHYFNPREL